MKRPTEPDPYCKGDRFAQANGMEVVEVAEGYAKAVMTIQEVHLNCLDIVHGGVYFALADLACGASVDYVMKTSVTLNTFVEFIKSAKLGDTVTAISHVESQTRKFVRTIVELFNQDDELLYVFRSVNYRVDA